MANFQGLLLGRKEEIPLVLGRKEGRITALSGCIEASKQVRSVLLEKKKRSQISQINTRWKALEEIYQIHILAHPSDLNKSATFLHEVW